MEQQRVNQQSNKRQKEILIEFMKNHPNIAKNAPVNDACGRNKKKLLWQQLTEKLNRNGPPSKNPTAWNKVWRDIKYNTKRKLINNKKNLCKTGGGPFEEAYLSPLDEVTIEAAGLEASVTGVLNAKTFGVSNSKDTDLDVQDILFEFCEDTENPHQSERNAENATTLANDQPEIATAEQTYIRSRERPLSISEKYIKDELDELKKFHEMCIEKLEGIQKSQNKLVAVLEERNSIEKEKITIMKGENIENTRLRKRELEVKILEIEVLKERNRLP